MSKFTVIYPTSADPPTLGHLDILSRAAKKFSTVYWISAANPTKKPLFSVEDRLAMMHDCLKHYKFDNVIIDHLSGALIRYALAKGADFIIRGLRNTTDFQLEYDMSSANRGISRHIETLCIFADPAFSIISSKLVKELALLGENFDRYVIPVVARRVKKILK